MYSFYPSERLSMTLFAKSSLVLGEFYFFWNSGSGSNGGNFHVLLSPMNHVLVQCIRTKSQYVLTWCQKTWKEILSLVVSARH